MQYLGKLPGKVKTNEGATSGQLGRNGLERRAADPLPNEGDRWSLAGYWNPSRVSRTRENWMVGRAEPWEVEAYPRSLHRTTDCTRLQFSHLSVLGRLLEAQESFNSSHLRQKDGSHPTLHSTHSKRKSKFFFAALGVYGSILPLLTGSMTVCRRPPHHGLSQTLVSNPLSSVLLYAGYSIVVWLGHRRSLIPQSGLWRVARGAIGTSARGGSNNRGWLLLLIISIVRSRYFRRPAAMSPRLVRRRGEI
ncbi:uncharacterized protein BO87DRAFT_399241 [Aspergillus neoniger CBS 115656]|uniref:Uncharacterized protein n=1 Tax=Aspergillus neoniger (strain CBS 115656) TaxID=1448310 RepID=A0A318YGU4_ASPNB|nr:hypothetical protein BO87DRAFT_399241 [Aspergillus neoniger CBS 115656]PYH31780.1 hypothetical protein BO87DRAFT_399241 [Aspergillus neoniger CBS 115656]